MKNLAVLTNRFARSFSSATVAAVAAEGASTPSKAEPVRPKKFPVTTPVGKMRLSAKEMPHKDLAFFYKQKIRLTLSELDVFLQ